MSKDRKEVVTVSIGGVDLSRIEYRGEQVATFNMVDRVHQRADGTARRTFNENRSRFVKGEDYIELNQPDEIRTLGLSRPQGGTPASVNLLTRRGYLKLVKPLTDDRAWAVQGEMIDRYFAMEAIADDLGPNARRTIGGIVKSVVPGLLAEALAGLLPSMLKAQLEADERAVAIGFKPALMVLIEKKVPARKRRAFSQKVSARLRRFSADHGFTTRISRESGRWLFQVEAIELWLKQEGEQMIRDHIANLDGQGMLRLVRP